MAGVHIKQETRASLLLESVVGLLRVVMCRVVRGRARSCVCVRLYVYIFVASEVAAVYRGEKSRVVEGVVATAE